MQYRYTEKTYRYRLRYTDFKKRTDIIGIPVLMKPNIGIPITQIRYTDSEKRKYRYTVGHFVYR